MISKNMGQNKSILSNFKKGADDKSARDKNCINFGGTSVRIHMHFLFDPTNISLPKNWLLNLGGLKL